MGKNEVEIIVTAEDKASQPLNGIQRALGGIGRVAVGAAVGGIAIAGGAMALAGRSAIQMNSDLESSTLQFETLMGDADRAEAHVRGLFDFAARTPFETGPIIEASRVMQVFGGDALNTEENLTHIGNTAAAVGAPIEDIGFWVGRAYAAIQGGQPFGEAAQNLMQMGAVSPDVIARMNELKDSGADADEIFAVLQDHMGTFSGAMEKQAGTWQGLMSTIKDNLNMAAAEALKPFFDLAKQGLSSLATWLNSPGTQAGIRNLAEGFKTLLSRLASFVNTAVIPFVRDHGQKIVTIITAIVSAIGTFVIITSTIAKVVAAKAAFAALGTTISGLGGGLTGLVALIGGPVTLVIAAIAAVVALFTVAWRNNWGDIQGKVAAVWAFLQPIFQAIIEWIGTRVREGIEQLRAFWVGVAWPAIQRAIEIVWPVIQRIFTAIKDFILTILIPTLQRLWQKWTVEIWPVIQRVTQNVWTIIKEIFFELGRWINENIIPWINELKRIWTVVVWPAIQKAIKAAWDFIEPIWISLKEWLSVILPPIINGLRTIFENVMGGIRAAIQPAIDLWNNFVNAVKEFWDWLSGKNFNFNIGAPNTPPSTPGGPAPRSADFATAVIGGKSGAATTTGRSVVVNIDARGAGKGVDKELRVMIEDVMRQYASRTDVRLRTV